MRGLLKILIPAVALAAAGCSSVRNGGQKVAKTGTGVLVTSSAIPVLIPVGIVIAFPFWVIGVPTYYLAGGNEEHPFDL